MPTENRSSRTADEVEELPSDIDDELQSTDDPESAELSDEDEEDEEEETEIENERRENGNA